MNDYCIKSALYYAHPDSGASIEEARGLIIGVVSTLMDAYTWDWKTAIEYTMGLLPDGYRPECIPQSWRKAES